METTETRGSRRLRQMREELGLTVRALAADLGERMPHGVSHSHVHMVMRGKKNPGMTLALAIESFSEEKWEPIRPREFAEK